MYPAARLPYFGPVPWLIGGAVIGVALLGPHSIGHLVLLGVALMIANKWAYRWYMATNANPNGNGQPGQAPGWANMVWPSCRSPWGRRRDQQTPAEPPSSGNHAFDDYRREMLRRLEQDQQDFTAFLDRLRRAKDKSEFDQFMADRERGTAA